MFDINNGISVYLTIQYYQWQVAFLVPSPVLVTSVKSIISHAVRISKVIFGGYRFKETRYSSVTCKRRKVRDDGDGCGGSAEDK